MRTEGDLYVQVNHFIVHRDICPLSGSFDDLNPRTAENLGCSIYPKDLDR